MNVPPDLSPGQRRLWLCMKIVEKAMVQKGQPPLFELRAAVLQPEETRIERKTKVLRWAYWKVARTSKEVLDAELPPALAGAVRELHDYAAESAMSMLYEPGDRFERCWFLENDTGEPDDDLLVREWQEYRDEMYDLGYDLVRDERQQKEQERTGWMPILDPVNPQLSSLTRCPDENCVGIINVPGTSPSPVEDKALHGRASSVTCPRCQTQYELTWPSPSPGDWGSYLKEAKSAEKSGSRDEKRLHDELRKDAPDVARFAYGGIGARRDDRRALLEDSVIRSPRAQRGKRKDKVAAVKVTTEETETWTQLGNDETAIRSFMASTATQYGYDDLDALIRPFPRGRLSKTEASRYDDLASAVAAAQSNGAKLEALGAVIGRPKQRVHDLVQRAAA